MLAVLNGAKARLLKDHLELWSEIEEIERPSLRLAYWNKAVEYDPTKAAYYVGRGTAKRDLVPQTEANLLQAIKDADQAIAIDPSAVDSFYLLGEANLDLSRNQLDPEEIRASQRAALSAFQRMTIVCEATPSLQLRLEEVYYLSSSAHTELANFIPRKSPMDEQEVKTLLETAKALAEKSLERNGPFRANAHRALGNALEDLAWIVGDKKQYDAAIASFQADIDLNTPFGEPSPGLCCLARCRFKKLEETGLLGVDEAAELTVVEALLKKAIDGSKNNSEAYYWLGRVRGYRALNLKIVKDAIDDFKQSNLFFDEAIRSAAARGNRYDEE